MVRHRATRHCSRSAAAALHRIVESGPLPPVHGVVRWRLIDLAQWVFDEFRISISKQTLSRELRAVGFRKLSARPRHHAQMPRGWRRSK
jgi:putative transposase